MITVKGISHPDNSDSQNLFNAGSVPESINVLQSEYLSVINIFPAISITKISLIHLDSTGSARPISAQTPHLLTLSHLKEIEINHFYPIIIPFPPLFVGLPHLIHQVREEQGELASSPRKEVNVDLNIMLNFPSFSCSKLFLRIVEPASCPRGKPRPCRPVNDC